MNYLSSSLRVFAVTIILMISVPCFAKTEEKQLRDYVQNLITEGYNLFNNKKLSSEQRAAETAELLQENLYFEWMAKYSLGRHRRTLTKAKVHEFTEIYSRFVVKAYVDLTQHYNGEMAELKKVKQIDDDMFIVKMEILKPGSNSPIKVDYLVHQLEDKKGEPFKIGDIITEGISILNSQQAEFNSVITNQGIDALIVDLKSKLTSKPKSGIKKVRY